MDDLTEEYYQYLLSSSSQYNKYDNIMASKSAVIQFWMTDADGLNVGFDGLTFFLRTPSQLQCKIENLIYNFCLM